MHYSNEQIVSLGWLKSKFSKHAVKSFMSKICASVYCGEAKKKTFCDHFLYSALTFIKCTLWHLHSFTYSLQSHSMTFLLSVINSILAVSLVAVTSHMFGIPFKVSIKCHFESMLLFLFDIQARRYYCKV